ncbi:glycosyltransferase family 9 protein [Geobacter sp. AOG1]|uniref:glycosyltransferase family 9 protein n=1 Tax=Geobacter sp. AOG1 TaxID=1566346 RepID=UPI001CC721D4|nr:glycosyltransferase family 9 protein [Geobacter sp. AOG1]GFE58125.1 ADP-heptose-LPS heptosyltransferase [Geobacter sp. AOG1]
MDYGNILIIKPGAIGDLLQLTPAIRALHGKYPEARISILVSSAATAALFQHNPHVHEAIVFDKRGVHRSLSSLARLWLRLYRARYDLVVNFQRSNLKAWFLVSAALPCRVLVYHKARGRTIHAVLNHIETLAPLGIDPLKVDQHLEFEPGADAAQFAADLFNSSDFTGKPVIALNPGASNRIKCWSPQRFARLGDRLVTERGAGVVIVGGADERDLAEAIVSSMKSPVLDLVGRTTLLQLGAVLQRCTTIVTGDTGPLHMATAVGTTAVALFGAINPERTGPVGEGHSVIRHPEVPCVPCVTDRCVNPVVMECMKNISVEEVLRVVERVIETGCGKK